MNRRVKVGAAAISVALVLTACGTSGTDNVAQPQEPTYVSGEVACMQVWGGTVVTTVPDDDPGERPDVICQTADGKLVQLDGDDAELESNSDNYPVYEEGDNGLFFLFLWINGVKTKVGTQSYTPPSNYRRPQPGRYTVPTTPRNPGSNTTGGGTQRNGGSTAGNGTQRNGGSTGGSTGRNGSSVTGGNTGGGSTGGGTTGRVGGGRR